MPFAENCLRVTIKIERAVTSVSCCLQLSVNKSLKKTYHTSVKVLLWLYTMLLEIWCNYILMSYFGHHEENLSVLIVAIVEFLGHISQSFTNVVSFLYFFIFIFDFMFWYVKVFLNYVIILITLKILSL